MVEAIVLAMALAASEPACIGHVHDGDSVTLCSGERVRIADIDAPELDGSPRCSPGRVAQLASGKNPAWCDYALGVQARDALRAFLGSGAVVVRRQGVDRYGRSLATLSVNGRDAGEYLVGLGLARIWRR